MGIKIAAVFIGILIMLVGSFLTWVSFYSKQRSKEGWGKKKKH